MADIRINALATTAASTASDDFIAVDGSANGTRKLNAYSPTFGGNLTVSGTGTSAFSGAIKARSGGADEVGVGPYGTGTGGIYFGNGTVSLFNDANTQLKSLVGLSLAGNLTVSGTGTSSVAGVFKAGTDIVTGDTSAFQVHNNVDDKPMVGFYRGGTLRSVLRLNTDNDFRLLSSDLSTPANLTVGNVLLGTTTDTGGRLVVDKASQVAASSTASGGIVVSNLAGGNAVLELGVNATYLGYIQTRNYTTGSYYQLNLNPVGGNVLIGTTSDTGEKLQVNGMMYVSGASSILGDLNTFANLRSIGATNTIRVRGNSQYIDFTNAAESGYVTGTIIANTLNLFGNNGTGLAIGATGDATFAGKVTATTALISSDYVQCDATGAYNLGNPTTDGTWRFVISGTGNLLIQRRESGAFVTKSTISA